MSSSPRDIYRALRDRVDLHDSYLAVFSTPDGQRVLRHICRQGHVYTSTFVAGDSHATSLNEGARRLALSILRFYSRDHTELIKQIEEGAADET